MREREKEREPVYRASSKENNNNNTTEREAKVIQGLEGDGRGLGFYSKCDGK